MLKRTTFNFVHRIKMHRRLLLALPSGEEHDRRDRRRHRPLQSPHGVLRHHLRWHLGGIRSWSHHVRLQERTFQEHVVIVERLVAGREHALCHVSAAIDVVVTINEDLWLDDRDQAVLLADDGVASQSIGVLVDRELTGLGGADLQDGAPLGKASSGSVVLLAALRKAIESLSGGLAIGPGELDGALVDLDAGEHTALLEDFDEGLAVGSLLEEGLLEEDGAAQVL